MNSKKLSVGISFAKNRHKSGAKARGGRLVNEERIHAERDALIHERQNEVERTLNRHDTLVRCPFLPSRLFLTP